MLYVDGYQERMEWLAAACHAKEEERPGGRHGKVQGEGRQSKGAPRVLVAERESGSCCDG